MKMKCLILLAMAVILATPAFAVEETYYGTKLVITTKYDTEEFEQRMSPTYYDDYVINYLQFGKENPVWSPDGSTIAFNGAAGYGLFTVPSTGGEARLVYNNYHKKEGYVYNGEAIGIAGMEVSCFTPDGKYLTFMDTILDPARGSAITENSPSSISVWHPIPVIYNLNLATGEVAKVVEEARDGNWSPDGRYFVYTYQATTLTEPTTGPMTTSQCKWGVNLLDILTGEKKTLVMWAYSPSFTPDGKYVIYTSQSSSTSGEFTAYGQIGNLYRIPITGGTPEQLTFCSESTEYRFPADAMVSPDGEWILFTGAFRESEDTWVTGLCVYNVKTGESFKAFPRADMSNMKAKWSPDGKKFVYMTKKTPMGSTTGRIFIADFQPTPFWKPTSVADAAPSSFAINGNHPNPFNPSTTIGFTLPSAGPASLAIYNIAGQKVRELAGGSLSAGAHSVVWDGRDSSGKLVSSGVYLTRLVMGANTVTHRMLLAK